MPTIDETRELTMLNDAVVLKGEHFFGKMTLLSKIEFDAKEDLLTYLLLWF